VVLVGLAVAFACSLTAVAWHYITRPLSIKGAVVRQDSDPRNQSPIEDVEIGVAGDPGVPKVKSDFSGFFRIALRRGIKREQPVTLEFRHPNYEPANLAAAAGDKLYVVHMIPLHPEVETQSSQDVLVTNMLVRYSTETTASVNVGTGVKTFEVENTGNVPCNQHPPCSPDNKWKASIGSASLDAGQGNVFRNARVSCIAGPCPFTRIDSDQFSAGGRNISVSVRDWSDTTTFLFQAEVFQQQVNDAVQESYPVVFGRALNFSLPPAAEGPTIEAELGGTAMVFPLGPTPILSWATCNVKVGKDQSKSYRCELKSGYRFQ
jgi:hypothetical protein